MEKMNILLTADENYYSPMCAMLQSLFINNPDNDFHIYLMHDHIPQIKLDELNDFCSFHGSDFTSIPISDETFSDAPVFRYLTKAMYYRLLAAQILPDDLSTPI